MFLVCCFLIGVDIYSNVWVLEGEVGRVTERNEKILESDS
jgi:hypothetical protein